jgi:hypothetical protein
MTPTLPDILMGQGLALLAPQPPEASGDYTAGRVGMIFMLATLAAQEAERGLAARLWENGALRALFARAAEAYDRSLDGALGAAAKTVDDDYALSALDRANADLRRLLIALHEAVEARADAALDREILGLYQAMARARRLELAPS